VRKTLSAASKRAKMPNGKGSSALTPGTRFRFTVLQIPTNSTCSKRKGVLPIAFTIASLVCSAAVRRSRASSSSFANRFNILLRGMWNRFLRRPLGHKVLKQLGQQARLYTVLALLSFQPDLNDGTNVSVGHFESCQHLVDLS
jgi:hypothetical protein